MVDGYDIPGNLPGNDLESLKALEEMYRIVLNCDRAKETAKTVFGDIDDVRRVHQIMWGIYPNVSDPEQQKDLGAAYNYLICRGHFRDGDEREARKLINSLVNRDTFFRETNRTLERAGTSFVGLCCKKQELLAPRDLDVAVFERYAPKSVEHALTYTKANAIAIATKQKKGTYISVRAVYDNSVVRKIKHDGVPVRVSVLSIELGNKRFDYRGDDEGLEKVVSREFGKVGVKKPCTIRATTPNIETYLLFKYLIMQQGLKMNFIIPGVGRSSHGIGKY